MPMYLTNEIVFLLYTFLNIYLIYIYKYILNINIQGVSSSWVQWNISEWVEATKKKCLYKNCSVQEDVLCTINNFFIHTMVKDISLSGQFDSFKSDSSQQSKADGITSRLPPFWFRSVTNLLFWGSISVSVNGLIFLNQLVKIRDFS